MPKSKIKISEQLSNNNNLQVKFGNVILERVRSVKYLGITIDEKLTWNDHINDLIKKIASLTGIVYRQRTHLPRSSKRDIYFSLADSHIVHGILVYANSCKFRLKALTTRVNSLLRALQGKKRSTPVADLY